MLIRTDRTTGLQRGSGDTQAAMHGPGDVGSAPPFSAPPSPLTDGSICWGSQDHRSWRKGFKKRPMAALAEDLRLLTTDRSIGDVASP